MRRKNMSIMLLQMMNLREYMISTRSFNMSGIDDIKFDTSSYKNNFLATKKQKDYIEEIKREKVIII